MSFWTAFGGYFLNFFKALLGQLGVKISQFVHDFVQEDLGKIALDAVAWIAATTDTTSTPEAKVAARDAAIAKFKADAVAAGHDVEAFGAGLFNFIIETAFQAFSAGIQPTPAVAAQIAELKKV